MKLRFPNLNRRRRQGGFTLEEIVVSMGIAAITFTSVITGYQVSSDQAEWSACSLAAQSHALNRLEQTKAAKWDTQAFPAVDQLTPANFPTTVQPLDILKVGTNTVSVTNITTISTVSANPPVKMVQVDCVWSYRGRGPFTNTVFTYRSPGQ